MSFSTITMLGATPTLPSLLPLVKDANGVVRVGNTRVTLETVFYTFLEGATPEEVMQRYPSLKLADIYAVFGYCVTFQEDVEEYVRGQQAQSATVQSENEMRFPPETIPQGVREKLLTHRRFRR